jgi:hypothetical protein
MKRLCQLAVVIMALLCGARAHAACGTITAGMSASAVQTAITSCSSGATAQFGAGSYSFSSTVSVPCGVSLAGPAVPLAPFSPDGHVHLLYGPTAIISATSYPVFSYGACATARSFEYLEVNTNHPSPDGGQAIYTANAGGVSNLTISFNYFHGNQANASGGNNFQDGLILFDGTASSAADVNDTVSWNRFGASGDCSNVMSSTSYSGFAGNGGFCNGVGFHGNMTNFAVNNNFLYYQEEGVKGYEGSWACVNCSINYNDFSNFHRIAIETQILGAGTVLNYDYNSMHDPFTPGNGTFGLSSANGCDNTKPSGNTCTTIDYGNVIIDNIGTTSPSPFNGLGIEFWSGDTASAGNYNFIQGQWSNSFMIAPDGALTASHNTIHSSYGNCGGSGGCNPGISNPCGWWNIEDSPANTATGTGNICQSYDGAVQTSATPTISPASGSFTTSQTVTFTNSGANRDSNTGIWYTTDGSTPVPGAGTAKYVGSGGTIAVSVTTTVKAVGMWGAANQPASYPTSGSAGVTGTFGYQASPVVSATYTAGAGPTLNSLSLSASGSVTSIATGASVQMNAACHYNNGTTTSCNTTDGYGNSVSSWNSSSPSIATISGSGLATGVAVGSTNLTAVAAGVTSAPFALSVTAPAVTLSSVTLAGTGGATSVVAGSTLQLVATCHYSDSSTTTCTTTDSHGNAPSSWASTAPTIGTVSSGGLVTGAAAGSTNLTAVVAGITSSPALTITVTAAPPTLTGGYLGTPGSANTMVVGGTLQFSAYCQYSNSTTTNCSVADMYGNAVSSWASSNTVSVTIGAVGSANPGLATAVGAGTPYIKAYVGSVGLNQWDLTVTSPAVSLTGVSLTTTGGVTGLFVGHTNQLVATCTYSDGSTTNCTTTDSHGNVAGSYSSSSSAHATVSASTGLVTGVAAGTTNLTAQAGSFTSTALPLSVLAIPSGVYVITLSGPVIFSGPVRF